MDWSETKLIKLIELSTSMKVWGKILKCSWWIVRASSQPFSQTIWKSKLSTKTLRNIFQNTSSILEIFKLSLESSKKWLKIFRDSVKIFSIRYFYSDLELILELVNRKIVKRKWRSWKSDQRCPIEIIRRKFSPEEN